MEGLTLYFGVLSIVSFINITIALFLLLKALQLKVHLVIVLICAAIITWFLIDTNLYPFRSVTNALILFVVLAVLYVVWVLKKYK